MTKILYIPTGEYIKFLVSSMEDRTEIFEDSVNKDITPEDFIAYTIDHNYSTFLSEKFGKIYTYCREEFEIIEDA